ncbi:hypothetical protein HYU21_02755, partial [Candidatus Woesearchaeota archaeon]|nr:hypothetical protein [Candidatus Woesearchaeota archaeon]
MELQCTSGDYTNPGVCRDTDVCKDGTLTDYELQDISCGLNNNGVQFQERTKECIDGQHGDFGSWTNYESCLDPDECVNGTTTQETLTDTCGINGRGELIVEYTCADGVYDVEHGREVRCDDPDVCLDGLVNDEDMSRTCGLNSRGREVLEREQTCSSGHWSSFGGWTVSYGCGDIDDCRDGATTRQTLIDACGINGRGELITEYTCTLGAWDVINGMGISCIDTDICKDETLVDFELQNISCGINNNGVQFQERTKECIDG